MVPSSDMTLPRGPRSALPQLLHFSDPYPYMRGLMRDWSDPVTVPLLGTAPAVITWGPEGSRAVFTADPDTFLPGANDALAVLVGEGSIFLMAGDRHKRARKLLAPPFHGDRMAAYGDRIREATRRHVAQVERGRPRPVLEVAQAITLDVIIEAVFGEREPDRIRELHADILALVAAFNPMVATWRALQRDFGGMGPWARFQRRAHDVAARIGPLLDRKRASPGEDIVSLLLATRDEAGDALEVREVQEQLLTFVIAGHETTSTSVAWAMRRLHENPAVLSRLRAELDEAGPTASSQALAALPFLEAVCHETLRLDPPVPMVLRRLAREFDLLGHRLPVGTTLAVALYMAHQREEAFPEPLAFRPERFLERRPTPFEFMPFGGGARRCIGAAFALYELKLVLAELLRAGRWSLASTRQEGRAFRIGTYGPAAGVRMTLAPT